MSKIGYIWVDGKGYQGEHADDLVGPQGNPNQMNRLVFGPAPIEIGSPISVLSHLERIIQQWRLGYINVTEIRVALREENKQA